MLYSRIGKFHSAKLNANGTFCSSIVAARGEGLAVRLW